MFLNDNTFTENVNVTEYDGLNIVVEAQRAFHALEVATMKCEHSAIVTENQDLYNEGIKEYASQAGTKMKELLAKIGEFIARVVNKIKMTILSIGKVKQHKMNVIRNAKTFRTVKIHKAFINFSIDPARILSVDPQTLIAASGGMGSKDTVDKALKALNEIPTVDYTPDFRGAEAALKYFDGDYKKLIGIFESTKKAAKEAYDAGMEELKKDGGKVTKHKDDLIQLQRLATLYLRMANMAAADALKVIGSAGKSDKAAEGEKKDGKVQNNSGDIFGFLKEEGKKDDEEPEDDELDDEVKNESGILSQFGYM